MNAETQHGRNEAIARSRSSGQKKANPNNDEIVVTNEDASEEVVSPHPQQDSPNQREEGV